MAKGEFSYFGLASLRREAGVSIDQIMDQTKISRRFVEAIDSGDYDQLPGGIFTVSYIRQYAEVIGQDPEAVLLEVQEQIESRAGTAGNRPEKPPHDAADPARWVRYFSMG